MLPLDGFRISISPASSGSLGERETVVFAAYDAAKGTGEDGG